MVDEVGWYYFRNGGSAGPESSKRLLELLDSGEVKRETPVWRDGVTDWQPLETAFGLREELPPALPGLEAISFSTNRPDVRLPAPSETYPDYSPHPWRRYFARMLDSTVGASLLFFAFGIVLAVADQDLYSGFTEFLGKSDNRIINSILTFAIATLPNALCIGFTGSSLGKWIFGISVTREDGRLLGFKLGLRREIMVWVRGLGLALPLISLITLVTAYKTVKAEQKTSWDADLQLKVGQRSATPMQMVLNFAGVALWLAVLVSLLALNNA